MVQKKFQVVDTKFIIVYNCFMKSYIIEDDDYTFEIPKDVVKDIISDHLEKYYIWSLTLGIFIIGFLLGVIAS